MARISQEQKLEILAICSYMVRRIFSSVISIPFSEWQQSTQRIFSAPFFYVIYCLSQHDEKGIASTPPVFSQPGSYAKRHSCGNNLTRRLYSNVIW